jgi:hypothetical protein
VEDNAQKTAAGRARRRDLLVNARPLRRTMVPPAPDPPRLPAPESLSAGIGQVYP